MTSHAILAKRSVLALLAISLWALPASALEIKRTVLSNGAVLMVSEEHQLPMVTISIAFDAGARRDPQDKAGLATLTAASLEQGTQNIEAADFNRQIDFMGSSVSVGADHDNAVAGMTSLTKYKDQTLHLLTQMLADPGLRDADILRKRGDQLADLKASEEEPGYVAQVAFIKELFGDGPYGHPISGLSETVSKLTPDDVRSFYRDHYKIGSAVIAVTGDVEPDAIKQQLEKELSALPGTVSHQEVPPPPEVPPGIHLTTIDRSIAQANLILGSGGVARSNPDYYKLQVMNYILGGGGFSSRLMKVVRSKGGLAYTVASGFEAGKFPGAFLVILQTKNASANEALKLVLQQMQEIREAPVSAAEINSAKKYLIGSFPMKLDRQSQIASFMLEIQLYGLGLDYADRYPKLIDSVTIADVQEVARKYIHPDAIDVVAVADQAQAKVAVANFTPSATASNH